MKTIDITLASPATALLVEQATRIAGCADAGPFSSIEKQTLRDISDAIKTARLRVESVPTQLPAGAVPFSRRVQP